MTGGSRPQDSTRGPRYAGRWWVGGGLVAGLVALSILVLVSGSTPIAGFFSDGGAGAGRSGAVGSTAPKRPGAEPPPLTAALPPATVGVPAVEPPLVAPPPGVFDGAGVAARGLSPALARLQAAGIPPVMLAAYQRAAALLAQRDPSCGLRWSLLAAIGRVESDHGRGGAGVVRDGMVAPPILGPVLDGSPGVAPIPDSDGGRLDGDPVWDRAVGPMQFLPSTWRAVSGDANPNNVYDAALAAARYLCRTGVGSLTDPQHRREAVYAYNHSWPYVDTVLAWAAAYDRAGPAAAPPVPVPFVRPVPPPVLPAPMTPLPPGGPGSLAVGSPAPPAPPGAAPAPPGPPAPAGPAPAGPSATASPPAGSPSSSPAAPGAPPAPGSGAPSTGSPSPSAPSSAPTPPPASAAPPGTSTPSPGTPSPGCPAPPNGTPAPGRTGTPTPTSTSPVPSPTRTASPSPTASPTPTASPSPTVSPPPTASPSPTPTASPSPTVSPTPTASPAPTPSGGCR